ncbi:MAG: type II toxin-antitoxin system PemK/MazF family toxin [Synechococcales bacterium]|nr:type II toxin-antitoxin system PemK/MazF family toxin [Synechococcales bacterium]
MMPSTTSYEFGNIVLVPFPFTDQTSTKKRPAVVISSNIYNQVHPDLIVMAVTSQRRVEAIADNLSISDWHGISN